MAKKSAPAAARGVRLPILWQLLLAFIPLAVFAIAVVGVVSYRKASESLRDQAIRQLQTVRDNKVREISRYLRGVEDQVATWARNPTTAAALKQFNLALRELDTDPMTEPDKIRPQVEAVKSFLQNQFAQEIKKGLSFQSVMPTQRSTLWLQYHYLANSPARRERVILENAKDGSKYSGVHAMWHSMFSNVVVRFGFEDLYLIDYATKRIVYSVNKNTDFLADLSSGPYAESALGKLVRKLDTAKREGDFEMTDFAPYLATLGMPAAFAGTPIFENGQRVGTMVVGFTLDEINGIMTGDSEWEQAGLGKTGEAYIVGHRGNDLLMRSESRFLSELEASNASVLAAHTAVLTLKVESEAALLGNDKKQFSGRYQNYRGVPVLGASTVMDLPNLDWIAIAEISESEALAPVEQLRTLILYLSSGLVAVFVVVALVMSIGLTRPVRALANVVSELQKGNYRARAKVRARNELGLLADGLNQALDERVETLAKVEDENKRLQTEIRGLLNVVAAASDGDFTMRAVVGSGTLGNLSDALNLMFENISELIGHLRGVSSRVVTAANQIQDSATQLAEGSTQQTADVSRTALAVSEMNERVQAVTRDAASAVEAAKRAELAAQSGSDVVKHVVAGMESLQKNTRASAIKIKRLGERSMEISTITGAIQKISAQTNMLALNAAIEASRAGEHGLGFSVVADEVRKLAEQTESAAREITELIGSIQTETNEAVSGMERQAEYVEEQTISVFDAGNSLERILEASGQSASLITEISNASEQQAKSANQLAQAMTSVSEVAQQAQAASEQTRQGSAELIEVAVELDAQIGLFRVEGQPLPEPTQGNGHATAH